MANPMIRRDQNTYDVYKVFYNCNFFGLATQVTLGSRDRWVGNDYWKYLETVQLSAFDQALMTMSELESKNQTDLEEYRQAQKIAVSHLLPKGKKHE